MLEMKGDTKKAHLKESHFQRKSKKEIYISKFVDYFNEFPKKCKEGLSHFS